ncbi:pentapeptide repeat-containing protein [Luteococcus sp. Sow4_B9]|uniref:pentapeptide repeat-containing protein n=1 Tax=Luteococcus sp. Sow4_B9 TaxID=3438792 RepID=UPI003F98AE94
MQALPKVATEPKTSSQHVTLSPRSSLGSSDVTDDSLVTELVIGELALEQHSSEFVELASVLVQAGGLASSDWYRTNWVDVELHDVDAANASFTESGLKRVLWSRARLVGLQASGCTLHDVIHRECPMAMSSLRFANMTRVTFVDCDLSGVDFTHARLADVTFLNCRLDGAQFSQAQCERVLVRGGSLEAIQGLDGLRGAVFDDVDLADLAHQMASLLGLQLMVG